MLVLSISASPALARSTVGKMMVGEPAVVVEKPQQNRTVLGVAVGRMLILPTVEMGTGDHDPPTRVGEAKSAAVVVIAVRDRGRRFF
jgi:hypothetical protein